MPETNTFCKASLFPCSAAELYEWHSRPGALERLIPPWERTHVLSRSGGIEPGSRVELQMYAGPIAYRWRARHLETIPGVMFRDMQEQGPLAHWTHTHRFADTPQGGQLEDQIDYALPGQPILPRCSTTLVNRSLERIFHHRHTTLHDDIRLHQHCSRTPLRLLVSGASGVLGNALLPLLTTGGHQVWTLVRRQPNRGKGEIFWDPEQGRLNLAGLPPFDGVIHLAGDNIGASRWTIAKKQRVIDSRVLGTGLLARTLAALPVRPRVLLSASAVGFYGNCLDSCMREEDAAGTDFISDVCSRWERSTLPAADAGIRTVHMRIGVVLSPRGGALQRLLTTAGLGFPRRFGDGRQFISWISIDDMIAAMLHALTCDTLSGPVNIAAPQPVTNAELMHTLATILNRPLLPPIPASLLKMIYGEMASEVVLGGCRVTTDKLRQSGLLFRHANLEKALRCLLGRFEHIGGHGELRG